MLIASPGDEVETKACMKYILKNPQPSYLRLSKSNIKPLHNKIPNLKPGKWLSIIKSKSTGCIQNYLSENFNISNKKRRSNFFELSKL
mgnify:CR=1 FL=1